jgi:hypothetical protein
MQKWGLQLHFKISLEKCWPKYYRNHNPLIRNNWTDLIMMLLECSLNGLVLVLVFSANWIKNIFNMGKWIKTTNMTAPNRRYIGYNFQPTRMHYCSSSVKFHLINIPVMFGFNRPSGFIEEDWNVELQLFSESHPGETKQHQWNITRTPINKTQ